VTRGPVGMVFDRALTPELLSVALRVATESGGSPDARRLLTIALRDHVSPQEAKGKMKKCLSRVWVNPPANAREMIRWAIDHQHLDVDGTVLHMGAVLATFPFAGVVAAIVGRQLHLEGAVDPRRVRAEARGVTRRPFERRRRCSEGGDHDALSRSVGWPKSRTTGSWSPADRGLCVTSLGDARRAPHPPGRRRGR
jgi:hypothetical protein